MVMLFKTLYTFFISLSLLIRLRDLLEYQAFNQKFNTLKPFNTHIVSGSISIVELLWIRILDDYCYPKNLFENENTVNY